MSSGEFCKKEKKKERDSQLLRAISLEALTMSTPLDAVKVCNNKESNIFIVASCNILKTKLQAGTNNPMCCKKKVEEHDGLAQYHSLIAFSTKFGPIMNLAHTSSFCPGFVSAVKVTRSIKIVTSFFECFHHFLHNFIKKHSR